MPEHPPVSSPPLSLAQVVWRTFIAIILWLLINLIIFLIVSFIAFSLLSSLGQTNPDQAFSLAMVCAIPAALTVSSLIVGRRLIDMVWRRYRA
jgi:hypothetical protein